MAKIKILILLPSFAGGGAERTILNILTYYDREQFDIKVCIFDYSGPYLQHIDPGDIITPKWAIGKIDISKMGNVIYALKSLVIIAKLQRECLQNFQPQVMMTVTESMNFIGLLWKSFPKFKSIKWIVRCGNNSYAEMKKNNIFVRGVMLKGLKWCYNRCDIVLAISNGVAKMIVDTYRIPATKVKMIYNPVDIKFIEEKLQCPPLPEPFILGVGRLEWQKRFDVLIKAYAQSIAPKKGIKLYILGIGSKEQELKNLVRELQIDNSVVFHGFQANPYAFMNQAKMFVLSSQWEGFAHVVVEALACKVPTVVTDCPYGPSEIVQHQQSGFVVDVNDIVKMSQKINFILSNTDVAKKIASQGCKRAQDFAVQKIVNDYENLFKELS